MPAPYSKRCWFTFPTRNQVEQPIIWQMSRKFPEMSFDIRQASVQHEIGIMAVLLSGNEADVNGAIEFLRLRIKCRQSYIGRGLADQRRWQKGRRTLKQPDIKQPSQADKNHHRNKEKQPLHVWLSSVSPLSSSNWRTLLRARAWACQETTIATPSTSTLTA